MNEDTRKKCIINGYLYIKYDIVESIISDSKYLAITMIIKNKMKNLEKHNRILRYVVSKYYKARLYFLEKK